MWILSPDTALRSHSVPFANQHAGNEASFDLFGLRIELQATEKEGTSHSLSVVELQQSCRPHMPSINW